jgi:glycosyltransferase involved in cell wall biosynthesis
MRNIEIIIVNDGTPDDSINKIKKFLDDGRITLLNKKNGGLSSARNAGIKIARGEYIFHLDSDDFIDLEAIEKMYDKAMKYNLDVVITDINVFYNQRNNLIWRDGIFTEEQILSPQEYLIQFFLGDGTPAIWNKLWKKNLYLENKIFHPENISYGEDGATMPKLILKSSKIGKINEALYKYRQTPNSMMKKSIKIAEYLFSYNGVIDFMLSNNEQWIYKYADTFKYNYVYIHLKEYILISPTILKNLEYKNIYIEFLNDMKNKTFKVILKTGGIKLFFKKLEINCYKKSLIIGEIMKLFHIIISKIKIKLFN